MVAALTAGPAVCAHNNAALNTSTFDNLSLQLPLTDLDIGALGLAGSGSYSTVTVEQMAPHRTFTGTNQFEIALSASQGTTLAPTGLVAHLSFDDGTANDSSGYGNHGTLVNGAAVVNDPDRGKVLSLNGTSSYVDLGNRASLDLSGVGQATIAAWVKVAATQNHNTIVSKGEWKEGYSLVVKGDTVPPNLLWTGNDTSVYSGGPVPLNTWAHVAVTINGDLTTFYLNGQVSGAANQDRGNPIDNTATGVSIGREQYSGSMPAGRWLFNGLMDDVRIYARALTQPEIQSIMVGTPPTPALITGYTLNGPNLVLSGSNGVPGRAYYVLASSNVALPLAQWTSVETNAFGPGGSFSFTNATAGRQRFYLLQSP